MECLKEANAKACPCTYSCDRHGFCCACLRYHLGRGELPACCFSKGAEATYDRSFEAFARDRGFT